MQTAGFLAAAYDLNRLKVVPAVKAPPVMALGLMLVVLALGLKNVLASRVQS